MATSTRFRLAMQASPLLSVFVRGHSGGDVQHARADPVQAQALYDFLASGCRTPRDTEQVLANFDELGIPTSQLSHNHDRVPFA